MLGVFRLRDESYAGVFFRPLTEVVLGFRLIVVGGDVLNLELANCAEAGLCWVPNFTSHFYLHWNKPFNLDGPKSEAAAIDRPPTAGYFEHQAKPDATLKTLYKVARDAGGEMQEFTLDVGLSFEVLCILNINTTDTVVKANV